MVNTAIILQFVGICYV